MELHDTNTRTMTVPVDPAARVRAAQEMAAAALEWIDSLTGPQRASAVSVPPSRDDLPRADRVRWFYTPTDHGGLPLYDQGPRQQQLAMRLLASGLTYESYVTAALIMGTENVLDHVEGWSRHWERDRGRDPSAYWIRIFGDPRADVWGWRYGGHHLSFNFLVLDGCIAAATPCFLGSDPASAPLLGGGTSRPLGATEDLARELVHALDEDQRQLAVVLDRAPADLVTHNSSVLVDGLTMRGVDDPELWGRSFADDSLTELLQGVAAAAETASGLTSEDHRTIAYTSQPLGIAGRDLSSSQRELLSTVVAAYTGRVRREAHPASDGTPLDEVRFAWAGSLEPGQPHYYRVQGPRLLLEYDNTQRSANHAHSVWRDPSNDFGMDLLRRHHHDHPH